MYIHILYLECWFQILCYIYCCILLYMFILLFIIGNNLLMTRSVHWWVGRRPDCHNFLKGGKFHFHAPNGALVFKELIPFPVFYLLSLFYHSIYCICLAGEGIISIPDLFPHIIVGLSWHASSLSVPWLPLWSIHHSCYQNQKSEWSIIVAIKIKKVSDPLVFRDAVNFSWGNDSANIEIACP